MYMKAFIFLCNRLFFGGCFWRVSRWTCSCAMVSRSFRVCQCCQASRGVSADSGGSIPSLVECLGPPAGMKVASWKKTAHDLHQRSKSVVLERNTEAQHVGFWFVALFGVCFTFSVTGQLLFLVASGRSRIVKVSTLKPKVVSEVGHLQKCVAWTRVLLPCYVGHATCHFFPSATIDYSSALCSNISSKFQYILPLTLHPRSAIDSRSWSLRPWAVVPLEIHLHLVPLPPCKRHQMSGFRTATGRGTRCVFLGKMCTWQI